MLRLDTLEPAESLDLLTHITTAAGPRDLDGAAELCDELGHLPLAIEQAAAYLAQNPLTTPRTYLDLLAHHPADMYRHGAVTTPDERTIARIWNITLDRITTLQPHAADLLRTLAWYASDNIPIPLATGNDPHPAAHAALGVLTAYSMITPDPEDPHRTPTAIQHALQHATTNLNTSLPNAVDDPATWPTWRTLLPHIDTLADHTPQNTGTVTTARVLNETGLFLHSQGLTARAIRHFQRAHALHERVLGADHPSTLTSRNNLAGAYESAGDLGRAIPLYEQNLTDTERVLGPDHPLTRTLRRNLHAAIAAGGGSTGPS